LAAFDPGFTFPVTAVFSFEPGFSLLYRATPAFVIPAPDFVDLKYFLVLGGCLSLFLIMLFSFSLQTLQRLLVYRLGYLQLSFV
jgi:hypothetical protein